MTMVMTIMMTMMAMTPVPKPPVSSSYESSWLPHRWFSRSPSGRWTLSPHNSRQGQNEDGDGDWSWGSPWRRCHAFGHHHDENDLDNDSDDLTFKFSIRMIPFSMGLVMKTQQQHKRPFLRRQLSISWSWRRRGVFSGQFGVYLYNRHLETGQP